MVHLLITQKVWPVAGTFRIARSALTEIHTVWVTLTDGHYQGRGECRPYARYGDNVESVTAEIEALRPRIEGGMRLRELQFALPPGPARNALDCAMWDLEAKRQGTSVTALLPAPPPQSRQTAFTLSLDTPEGMADAAIAAKQYPLLKIKIGHEHGLECVRAVYAARPDADLIVDANEAIAPDELHNFYDQVAHLRIALIEQPITAGTERVGQLPQGPIPFCADESLHTVDDLAALSSFGYRAVNVKLDKCGGLSAAHALMQRAKADGFSVMAGCMVASSLAMAPMMILESYADYIDLDGPLLLAKDCEDGLVYDKGIIRPPSAALWG
ncbi:dipeptide epimerase [Litorimonas sp. RW-G-Af-16]|uniref:dipeptide epimerase n=1 Tax=Litorimonas sp. RW-G-Af-16 TaxID=3241168 RepID=UPI00390CBC6E